MANDIQSTNFDKLSEEKKIERCLGYALMHCQSFLFNPTHNIPQLDLYKKELRAMIDWISKKTGMEGLPLY